MFTINSLYFDFQIIKVCLATTRALYILHIRYNWRGAELFLEILSDSALHLVNKLILCLVFVLQNIFKPASQLLKCICVQSPAVQYKNIWFFKADVSHTDDRPANIQDTKYNLLNTIHSNCT